MRVLVLLPTTGALNRVLRVTARPDLSTSQVFMQGDYKPLAISADYDALTAEAGPLAALAPLIKPGPHHLRLAGPIDSGKSWELPVLLAHLAVALGDELADEPARADVVIWSTGAIDLDLDVVDYDYKLAAKAAHSRACLQEAVAAGAGIVAILPACEEAAPLQAMLAEIGVQHARVERVRTVSAARSVLEKTLGRGVPNASPPAIEARGATGRRRGRIFAPLLALAGVALAAGVVAAVALREIWLPPGSDAGAESAPVGQPESTGQTVAAASQPHFGAAQTAADGDQTTASQITDQVTTVADQQSPDADQTTPDAAPGPAGSSPPAEAARADPPPAVQLVELRDAAGRSCFSVLFEHAPPRRINVAMDGPDRFHDSTGRNLCGVELALNPQSGAQGFDIDLAAQRSGFRMTPAGEPGMRNKIKIEFMQELRQTVTYNVFVKFGDAQDPSTPSAAPDRRLQHRIIGMTLGWSNEDERH